jgi:hypothetical protein
MSHICANDEYRSQLGATNRPENIVIRFVSFVSLSPISMYLNLKVVDVFSFHLQIFHCFIGSPSRRYFQGHSSWENLTPLLTGFITGCIERRWSSFYLYAVDTYTYLIMVSEKKNPPWKLYHRVCEKAIGIQKWKVEVNCETLFD